MNLNELFGLFSSDDEKEIKALANKVKLFYAKAMENLENVIAQNGDAFSKQPKVAFEQWYEHYFDRPLSRVIDAPAIYSKVTNNTMDKLIKIFVLLGCQNTYLKPKTGFAGGKSLLQIAPLIFKKDPKSVAMIEKLYGKFVDDKEPDFDPKDFSSTVKIGAELDWPGKGKITWKGKMWVDARQQPLPKAEQGPATQKAIDDGLVE